MANPPKLTVKLGSVPALANALKKLPTRQERLADPKRSTSNDMVIRIEPWFKKASPTAISSRPTPKPVTVAVAKPPVLPEISTKKRDALYSWSEADRDEILQMIDFGWSDENILQMLPHIERGSVSAFRAHVTRGTYSQGEIRGTHRKGKSHR